MFIPAMTTTRFAHNQHKEETPKERLKKYCSEQGKPRPHFHVERVDEKYYRAMVYVAKTCGRLTEDTVKSKWDAEMNAAKLLLQKLKL